MVIAIGVNILKCESANCPDRHASFLDLQQMILVVALFEHLVPFAKADLTYKAYEIVQSRDFDKRDRDPESGMLDKHLLDIHDFDLDSYKHNLNHHDPATVAPLVDLIGLSGLEDLP